MNSCNFNTYLTAYVLRDMDQKRLDALDAHLKTCPDCQKKTAELSDTLSLLKEAFPAEKAQTGKAPVLDPERRQQLLTINPLPKPNVFRRFIDKAYRPLRMIAATLICVFGLMAILSAAFFPADKDVNRRGKAKHAGRNVDGYASGVIVNGPDAPAAEPGPTPIKIQPETIDEVTAVKSPVVMRGIYASRRGGSSQLSRSGKVPQQEGATTAAPAETVAPPPDPATPMPKAERIAYDTEVSAPEKTESSTRFRLGRASALSRAAGEESEKDALRQYERVAESKVVPDEKFLQKGIGGLTLSSTATPMSDFKLRIKNELKKSKADEDGDAFSYFDGAKAAADQSRLWSDSNVQNQKAEKKLEAFAEAADLRKKPAPPREPLPFNSFVLASTEPFSTFAMDVDTASYTLTRQALRSGKLPDPERVRLEEIVNAFDYADTAPDRATFRVYQDGAQSPFGAGYNLLRIGVKGRRLGREEQRPAMLTFVIDVSGSMSQPDRIGFARQALSSLLEHVGSGDRIQIIAYSDHAQFVLPPSPASEKASIMAAFDRLQCNGSTNLEEGLRRAYEQAGQAFIPGAENRVILISDGVANLGADSAQEILTKVAANRKQGITCSVFGVGSGTYNDKMLQELANKGDGVYRFLDSAEEVKTAFVDDLAATLNFIAKDAKIQVEWNPKTVRCYRQMGYEKRKLTKEQFRDDTVDAGEVGSGQSVTALYELELMPNVTPESSLGTVRIRYQRTDNGKVEEIESALVAATVLRPAHQASVHFKVAASAAEFAELLRRSPHAQNGGFDTVADYLRPAALERSLDTRIKELLDLVTTAASLSK